MDPRVITTMRNTKLKQSINKSQQLIAAQKPNDGEKAAIEELKQLYAETVKIDIELQHEIYKAEKSFEHKHMIIYDKRFKLLEDLKTKMQAGDGNCLPNICKFWLKVLKSSYPEFITIKDEQILAHLIDLRSVLTVDPQVKFCLEFTFEPNEFFTNKVLTKTYFLNCSSEEEALLLYDGAEINKCEGCQIDWKPDHEDRPENSFFDFFEPPELPTNPDAPGYCEINTILQNDFELGFYLKERVIPKAVMFYTGEIVDCQCSDLSDSDDDDDDIEEEDSTDDEKPMHGDMRKLKYPNSAILK